MKEDLKGIEMNVLVVLKDLRLKSSLKTRNQRFKSCQATAGNKKIVLSLLDN